MKNLYCWLVAAFAMLSLAACHDTETYADQKKKERAAIRAFIEKEGIKVISEQDFKQDTITDVSKKEFVLFENTGVSLHLTNNVRYFSSLPDKMAVTNTLGTFNATFSTGVMKSIYGTTSVPAGWLTPLSYINIGRLVNENDELAKVNIIVPHSQGVQRATASVTPYYYQITYERGI